MRENCNYEIIYAFRINEKEEIVLGKLANEQVTEFVTWICSEGNNYFWGHYFDDEIASLEDLLERIKTEKGGRDKWIINKY